MFGIFKQNLLLQDGFCTQFFKRSIGQSLICSKGYDSSRTKKHHSGVNPGGLNYAPPPRPPGLPVLSSERPRKKLKKRK